MYKRSRSQNWTDLLESFLSMSLLLPPPLPLLKPLLLLLLLLLLLCAGLFLLAPNLDSSSCLDAASSSLGEAEEDGSSSTTTPEEAEEVGEDDEEKAVGESVVVVCETMTRVREAGSRYMEVRCVEAVTSMPGGAAAEAAEAAEAAAEGGTEWKRGEEPLLPAPSPPAFRLRKLRAKSTLLLGLPLSPAEAAFLSLLVGASLLLSLSWLCVLCACC